MAHPKKNHIFEFSVDINSLDNCIIINVLFEYAERGLLNSLFSFVKQNTSTLLVKILINKGKKRSTQGRTDKDVRTNMYKSFRVVWFHFRDAAGGRQQKLLRP